MTVRVAAYVDGFNLYNGMHAARERRGLWLDLESLLRSFLSPQEDLVVVHYFTALVRGDGPARARQEAYLAALRAHGSNTKTHVGRFQRKAVTCSSCSIRQRLYEEKESDVALGVQLVEDAALDRFDKAFIVSADSDMVPAIHSARRIKPAAPFVAIFPPRRSSATLHNVVDAALTIFDRLPERHQLPNPVAAHLGPISRPQYWR